jgi:sigma-B regulation protein RsbU (phosphoserine phosphatase)
MISAAPHLRERLEAGRAALDEITRSSPEPQLLDLLQRVDDALQEMRVGTWAVCGVCQEPISAAGMEEHPLVSICLGCMTEEQRDELERDLESAARVQRKLLPPARVSHDGWEIGYLWEPFGVVSGDHVDLVRPGSENGPLHVLLGDVAGKGVAASLVQSQLHTLLRALAPLETNLSDLLARANRMLFDATTSSFYVTLTALRMYPDGRVVLGNAGHPRPLLADTRGVRPVEDASVPLGMLEDAAYVERGLRLRSGDTLLLYTDGWTEAERDEEEYGVGRAAAALRRARDLPVDELLAECRRDLARFLDEGTRRDDLTLVAVRRTR